MVTSSPEHTVTFIIFGITGDLSKRKLIPAIYHLLKNKKLKNFVLIGTGRSSVTINDILATAKSFLKNPDPAVWRFLEEQSQYYQLDFSNPDDFVKLQQQVVEIEAKHALPGNRLFYLATLPNHFIPITENLAKSNLADKEQKESRIVYEKPFGHDLKSAKKINRAITKVFDEQQIYRIDHYLGKELVANIALLRFTNRVLEPLWNKNHLEHVQIILDEKLGIEGRGNFYNHYGALIDVVQNHMLQLLALTAMERPKKLSGEFIREEKAKVLKKVRFHDVLLGQYQGYTAEKGVDSSSKTETFAAVYVTVNNKRWQGVPFYLRTGKSLDKKETSIYLKFKHVPCLLDNCPPNSNSLLIRIQPNEGFFLELYAKVPGVSHQITPVKMDFSHAAAFPQTPEAYEVLLEDVIKGERSLFIRNDEIEFSWKIIDTIKARKVPLFYYEPGSKGPKELAEFAQKQGFGWKE